jgi:hypothetical protein
MTESRSDPRNPLRRQTLTSHTRPDPNKTRKRKLERNGKEATESTPIQSSGLNDDLEDTAEGGEDRGHTNRLTDRRTGLDSGVTGLKEGKKEGEERRGEEGSWSRQAR